LDRAGRTPGEVLFIDDVQANVDAAARLGMVALRFSDHATLERDLVGAGLLAST
jgi:2-haloacid dehalogenase